MLISQITSEGVGQISLKLSSSSAESFEIGSSWETMVWFAAVEESTDWVLPSESTASIFVDADDEVLTWYKTSYVMFEHEKKSNVNGKINFFIW